MLREDFGDAGDGPVDFVALDNEGRGDADDGVVGFLAEEAFVFEGFAIRAGVGVQFDGEPEAPAANFADEWTFQGAQFFEEVGAEFRGAVDQVFFDEDAQGRSRESAGERIAAESAAVIAGLEDAKSFV